MKLGRSALFTWSVEPWRRSFSFFCCDVHTFVVVRTKSQLGGSCSRKHWERAPLYGHTERRTFCGRQRERVFSSLDPLFLHHRITALFLPDGRRCEPEVLCKFLQTKKSRECMPNVLAVSKFVYLSSKQKISSNHCHQQMSGSNALSLSSFVSSERGIKRICYVDVLNVSGVSSLLFSEVLTPWLVLLGRAETGRFCSGGNPAGSFLTALPRCLDATLSSSSWISLQMRSNFWDVSTKPSPF